MSRIVIVILIYRRHKPKEKYIQTGFSASRHCDVTTLSCTAVLTCTTDMESLNDNRIWQQVKTSRLAFLKKTPLPAHKWDVARFLPMGFYSVIEYWRSVPGINVLDVSRGRSVKHDRIPVGLEQSPRSANPHFKSSVRRYMDPQRREANARPVSLGARFNPVFPRCVDSTSSPRAQHTFPHRSNCNKSAIGNSISRI
jgi:hypothetical protein